MESRVVLPEILDTLSPEDPGAVANRRDLRLINRIMGNWRWIARELRRFHQPGQTVVEGGAGEGDLGNFLVKAIPTLRKEQYIGLDLWGRPSEWPKNWGWEQADLLEYSPDKVPDIFIVNLLLHQFEDDPIQRLGERLADVPVWIINEPQRTRWAIWQLALLKPLGLHPVSWHDGRVSIRAGFRGDELANLLGAGRAGRHYKVSVDPRGGHRLISWKEN